MSMCEACAALVGVTSIVRPHESLVSDGFMAKATKTVERFRCRICNTGWSRIVPKPGSHAPRLWMRVQREATPHIVH